MRPSQTWGDKLPKVGGEKTAQAARPSPHLKAWNTENGGRPLLMTLAGERPSCQGEQMMEKKAQTQGAVLHCCGGDSRPTAFIAGVYDWF